MQMAAPAPCRADGRIVRSAAPADIPFLAEILFMASLTSSGRSFWQELAQPTGTPTRRFLEAMLAADASNWGTIEDFIVIDVDGHPAAACAVYDAEKDPPLCLPLNLDRFASMAEKLGWPESVAEAFRTRYCTTWRVGDPVAMTPQAPIIVESVAVLPRYRRLGLGRWLMEAAFDEARRRNGTALGVSVLEDNVAARRLYEQYFDPYITLHTAYFDGAFPSLTKFRAELPGRC